MAGEFVLSKNRQPTGYWRGMEYFGEPIAIEQNTGKRGDGPKGYHLLMLVMIGWNGISN